MKGYEPSIETSIDMKHLPCTTAIKGDVLHVIIHIPLYQSSLDLDLFRYIDHPVQQLDNQLYASLDLEGEPTFLGINRDESKYKEFSAGDLETCYKRNKRYFCPDVPLYSKSRPHCLWGLYKNHAAQVQEQCRVTLSKLVVKAVRIDQNRFMITDTDDHNELTLGCGNDVPTRRKFNGTLVVDIQRGCRASTNHVTINHPDYEPEVEIEGLVINDEITFASWIPMEEKPYFVEAATELLHRVGRKVAWADVATLTAFKAKIAAASISLPHFGGGIFGWILHAITPLLGTIATILLFYGVIRYAIPACRRWNTNRRHERATNLLNQPRAMKELLPEAEPMEVDDLDEPRYSEDPIRKGLRINGRGK